MFTRTLRIHSMVAFGLWMQIQACYRENCLVSPKNKGVSELHSGATVVILGLYSIGCNTNIASFVDEIFLDTFTNMG